MKLITTLAGLFAVTAIYSQKTMENDFVDSVPDKNHLLSLNFLGAYPLLNILQFDANQEENGYRNFLDGGFKVGYVHLFNSKFGLGIEYGLSFSKFRMYTQEMYFEDVSLTCWGTPITDQKFYRLVFKKHTGINFHTHTLVPKIEWKLKNPKMPTGFCHEVGLGLTLSYPIIKDYEYELIDYDEFNQNASIENYFGDYVEGNASYETSGYTSIYDVRNSPFWGVQTFYGMMYKKRLKENWLFTVGFRAQFYLPFEGLGEAYEMVPNYEYWMTREEMKSNIVYSELSSILRLNLGVVYSL